MRILCVFGRYAYGDPTRGESYEYSNFLPALGNLGHTIEHFDSLDRSAYSDFADLNRRLLERVAAFRPDLVFCVLVHYEVWTETLALIRSQTPAAVLHWGTDDSWKFLEFSRYIAPFVDIHVTTYDAALAQARRGGLDNVVSSQWAASSTRLAEPLPATACAHDISFVGAAYGDRRRWIEALEAAGLPVACFGHGWKNGPVAADDVYSIIRQSRISLNFADSGLRLRGLHLSRSRQIKARTFEVPGAGGFLLTQGADGLGAYLKDGDEIVEFDRPDRLVERARHFLGHPAERDRIARAGHERVRSEHTYEARFPPLLSQAADAARRRGPHDWTLDPAMIGPAMARHRAGRLTRLTGRGATFAASAIWGKRRGPRAVRRFLFELSWRINGAHTYSAAGLPGRLFYRES